MISAQLKPTFISGSSSLAYNVQSLAIPRNDTLVMKETLHNVYLINDTDLMIKKGIKSKG